MTETELTSRWSAWLRRPMARLSRAASISTSDPSLVPSMRGATQCVEGWRCWAWCAADWTASTPSTSAAVFRWAPSVQPGPRPERFARELAPLLEAIPVDRQPRRLAIDPGRFLVARAGWLVARVLHVRERPGADVERQVVLDAGMTELIRPALYGARHEIEALTSLRRPVAGPIAAPPRPPSSRGPCASRPTTSVRTICRRFGAATSSLSAMPARTRPRSGRPTTAGHGRRRFCSRRTAHSASRAGGDAWRTSAEYADTHVSPVRHQGVVIPRCAHHRRRPGASGTSTEPRATPGAQAEQVIHDTAGLLDAGTIRTVTLVGGSHRGADRQPAGRVRTARRRSWAVDHRRPSQGPARSRAGRSFDAVDPACSLVEQDPSGSRHRDRLCRDPRIPGASRGFPPADPRRQRRSGARRRRPQRSHDRRRRPPADGAQRRVAWRSRRGPGRSSGCATARATVSPSRDRPGRQPLRRRIRARDDRRGRRDDRSHRGAHEGRSGGLHAGRRLSHDRGDRAPRSGAHQPVGCRPQGL